MWNTQTWGDWDGSKEVGLARLHCFSMHLRIAEFNQPGHWDVWWRILRWRRTDIGQRDWNLQIDCMECTSRLQPARRSCCPTCWVLRTHFMSRLPNLLGSCCAQASPTKGDQGDCWFLWLRHSCLAGAIWNRRVYILANHGSRAGSAFSNRLI